MNRIIKCFILAIVLGGCVAKPDTPFAPQADIVPRPVDYVELRGFHTIRDDVGICADPGMEDVSDLIAADLSSFLGKNVIVERNICAGTILVRKCDSFSEIGTEGYKLNITEKFIEIIAADPAGIYFGYQTLKQMMPSSVYSGKVVEGEVKIPCARISDYPKYSWRGMHLDVSRHFMSVDEVKQFIDAMAMHKFNLLHWHLTDSQGWRIEIKKYPNLTAQGGFRTDRRDLEWSYHDVKLKGTSGASEPYYGGYYTQEEIKDVVAYAKIRGVSILPEIDMPGHSLAALMLNPDLACEGFDVNNNEFYLDNFCPGKEEVFSFLEDVLGEVIALFPYEYFHIGGDEVKKDLWAKCPDCQKRIADENLADVNELQSYFVNRIEKFVNAKGKKMIGWDEILDGKLSETATVMAWRGASKGKEAVELGHPVVMAPYDEVYFDYLQTTSRFEPKAIGGYNKLRDVYNWDPMPSMLTKEQKELILGAQGQLWTEHMVNYEHVEYMAFPRAIALAERLWSQPYKNNLYFFSDFEKRMASHYSRLTSAGINFRFQGKELPIARLFGNDLSNGKISITLGRHLLINDRIQIAIAPRRKNSSEIRLKNIRLEDASGNVVEKISYNSKVGKFNLLNFYTFSNFSSAEELIFVADLESESDGNVEFDIIARIF
ncbi:MAG: beta-N-acetylhexosaminidase [Spirochaetales bacterium]|nr:beta-N-acetylhexosaminidase [Spirochaetales bacterium]